MPKGVVHGEEMFFEDDISIIEEEIERSLKIPDFIPVFRDELQILYNGHNIVMTRNKIRDAEIKVYTSTYGFKEIKSPKTQEDEYFSSKEVKRLKADFISRVLDGISLNDPRFKTLGSQIKSKLLNKINEAHKDLDISPPSVPEPPGKGLIPKQEDGSLFNNYFPDLNRVLIRDGRMYQMATFPEYIAVCPEKTFNPKSFSKTLQQMCESVTPEEANKIINDNQDKIGNFFQIRNKIWHSNRSFRLFLDGTYWVPGVYRDKDMNGLPIEPDKKLLGVIDLYKRILEREIKINAAEDIA
jgi:hypothetical protein